MPLDVITVSYPKQESIFETLAPFVDKLVNLYNDKKMQEWNNQWMTMALKDIDKASDQETIDALFAKQNPPSEWMDTEGFTEFAKGAVGSLTMGPVQQKEIMTGGLSPEQIVPEQPEPIEPQLMPDKMEWNELYKFVSELPTGQVDWSNTLNIFQQRLESKKKLGDMATQFLNQILGQGVPDQRAKFASDVELTNYLKQTLYPEQVDQTAEIWKQAAILPAELRPDYLRQQGINIPKEEEKLAFDMDKYHQQMTNAGMEISGSTINPVTGNVSINYRPKADSPMELSDMIHLIKELDKQGIKASYSKDGLSVSMATPAAIETGKPPAYGTAQKIEEDLIANVEDKTDYNKEMKRLESLNIDTSAFNFADIMKKKYENAMQWVKYAFDQMAAGIEKDEEYNYKQIYKESWDAARRYEEEYFKETGKKLLTAPEEKTVTQKSPLNQRATTVQFVNDAISKGRTLDDYNLEELKNYGVDIELARTLYEEEMKWRQYQQGK